MVTKGVSLMKPRGNEQVINGKDPSPDQADLRSRAQNRLAEEGLQPGPAAHGEKDPRRLLHELQVHQVELEMQNEALRESRQALEASLEHYTDLYDFAQMGYFTLDGAGVIGEINLVGTALLGKFRSQVLGQRFAAFLSQDSRAIFDDFLARIRGGRTKHSLTVTLVSQGPEPTIRHLHIEGAPVVWPEKGSSRAVNGAVRLAALDITERKRIEEVLRQSEERYRLLVESANEGIVVEQEGMLKFLNTSLLEMTSYSAQEFASHPFIDYVHPEDREAIRDHLQRSLNGEKTPTGCAFRIVDKQGQVKWLHSNSVGIEWDSRPATLNFFTDVTERRRTEEEKASLEGQLRHAHKMEAVGTLAGGIAHEFNNLLAVVMGFAERAKELGRQRKDNTGEIDQIIQASDRAKDLVRQILTFSRKAEIDRKPINLNNSCINLMKMLEQIMPRRVKVETHLAPDLPLVASDSSQLDQVLINLATNARDAMPEGGKLTIGTELVSIMAMSCAECGAKFSGDHVLVSVTDTGEGMDQNTMARMYDPFFTTKGAGKGTGLGLSVVLGLVRDNGGHITCESTLGVGTTFKVYFPPFGHGAAVDNLDQRL